MATKIEKETEAPSSRTTRPRVPQLRMPDNIPAKFGVVVHDELQAQGVVQTEDVVELIGVMGISNPGHISFPLQKLGEYDRKRYELRIDALGSHNVAGSQVVGHQWMLHQTYPEMTA